MSAAGEYIPGAFVFPLVNESPKMKESVPHGFLPIAQKTGWMNGDTFLRVLKHWNGQVKSTPEKPKLLLMDNHSSHIEYPIILYAKENGIVLQTLVPHTSHAIQPLDRAVYGPLKTYIKEAHDEYLRRNPNKRTTIYDVPSLSEIPLQRACSERNIKSGFRATGIYPLNRNAIPKTMYAPSLVTELPGIFLFK